MESENGAGLLRAFIVLFLLAAPAVSLRIASHFSDNPYLQPLALTAEGLAAAEGGNYLGEAPRIDVTVDWGERWHGRMSRAELRAAIAAALESQTRYYRIVFRDVPGRGIGIRFDVGGNSYGPYAPGGMVAGIDTALIALRLTAGAAK